MWKTKRNSIRSTNHAQKNRSRSRPTSRLSPDIPLVTLSQEDSPDSPTLMGNFKDNFYKLCRRNGFPFIPDILPRPRPPCPLPDKGVKEEAAKAIDGKKSTALSQGYGFKPRVRIAEDSKLPPLATLQGGTNRAISPLLRTTVVPDTGKDTARPRTRQGEEPGSSLSLSSPPSSFAVVGSASTTARGRPGEDSQQSWSSMASSPLSFPWRGSSLADSLADSLKEQPSPFWRDGQMTMTSYEKNRELSSVRFEKLGTSFSEMTTPTEEYYTTFTTATRSSDYFRPCIQVEQDDLEEGPEVTEIYIRGWKLDPPMLDVLLQCWPLLQQLHAVHLWNTALNAQTVAMLADHLPDCGQLRTLVLDANPLEGTPVSQLLGPRSQLNHLSLRFCGLTDVEAYGIGSCLGSSFFTHTPLLTLNLSNNRITGVGAGHIASGLRVNHGLLTLNLASNRVGDEGALQLATALSQFPLTQEQVVVRRQILSKRLEKENVPPKVSTLSRPQSPSVSHKSTREKDSPKRGKELKPKESKDRIKPRKMSRSRKLSSGSQSRETTDSPQPTRKLETRHKPHKKSRNKKKSSQQPDKELDEENCVLTTETQLHDGELWIIGNRTLISLNLSRNQIGKRGLEALWEAVQAQTLSDITSARTSIGLRRLVVQRNGLPDDDRVMQAISTCMRCRDPLRRWPRVALTKTNVTPCSLPRLY